MISERPYRGRISIQDILLELERESGGQFDPHVAEFARRLIEKGLLRLGTHSHYQYPPGEDNTYTYPSGKEALPRMDGI
jgi:HD-GYP domain-containing protein (c-di-GMP phosphodiesterase class II)